MEDSVAIKSVLFSTSSSILLYEYDISTDIYLVLTNIKDELLNKTYVIELAKDVLKRL
jgi:hypothetical protein